MSDSQKTVLTTAKFDVVEHQQEIAGAAAPRARHFVVHPGAVTVIPVLDGDRVCLIRNFRVAVGKELVELPAGTIDRQEEPAVTAARELQEETGYVATQWRELPPFYMSPGILSERMHLFVAEGLTAGPPAREAGEQIDNLVVEWHEAVAMALRGDIEDAKSLVGILLWDRLRP